MPQETEIKLRVKDMKILLHALKRLGARPAGGGNGRIHEWNVIYDTPQGGLAKHGQLLRIRTESQQKSKSRSATVKKAKPRILLTFKKPALRSREAIDNPANYTPSGRHKVREEIEIEVADAAALGSIFEGLGMRGWFRYEKYRTTMKLPASVRWAKGLLIELDETPIGTFVELEGPPNAIDRAAQLLGYLRSDYILKSYLALYLEERRHQGESPRDMVFDRK
ncbi:MAG TPA: class IV adenylate cyclase [Terriglobales bacterium]|nr:class IV adenylate cyclase [Terriglobales bacterium]